MSIPTAEQRLAAELYFSEMRGWCDGTAMKPLDTKFTEHPTRSDLTTAYRCGYRKGLSARQRMASKCAARTGHKPNVLETMAEAREAIAPLKIRASDWLKDTIEPEIPQHPGPNLTEERDTGEAALSVTLPMRPGESAQEMRRRARATYEADVRRLAREVLAECARRASDTAGHSWHDHSRSYPKQALIALAEAADGSAESASAEPKGGRE